MKTLRDSLMSLHVYNRLRKLGLNNDSALICATLWERVAYPLVYFNTDYLYRELTPAPVEVESRDRDV